MRYCKEENCTKPHYAQGYCKNAYKRLLRSGTLSVVLDTSRTDVQRYEEFVDRSAGEDACHPWTGSMRGDYGRFTVKRASVLAHRWAFITFVQPLTGKQVVRHKCDNPVCQNLRHLEPGTHRDNTQDMIKRGRKKVARGEDAGGSKLTEDQVREIRSSALPHAELAKLYNISQPTISMIKSRKSWAHVL